MRFLKSNFLYFSPKDFVNVIIKVEIPVHLKDDSEELNIQKNFNCLRVLFNSILNSVGTKNFI